MIIEARVEPTLLLLVSVLIFNIGTLFHTQDNQVAKLIGKIWCVFGSIFFVICLSNLISVVTGIALRELLAGSIILMIIISTLIILEQKRHNPRSQPRL